MKSFLSDDLAAAMEAELNKEENVKLFSRASMLEKLAFTKEADGMCHGHGCSKACELGGPCQCKEECANGCTSSCRCHPANADDGMSVKAAFENLLKISEDLEEMGMEKTAALLLEAGSELVSEAKAKKSDKKDSKKSDKKDSKKSDKKDSKKTDKKTKK